MDHGSDAFFRPNANQRYSQYQDFDQDSFLVMEQEQPAENRRSTTKDQQLSGAAASSKGKRNSRSKQKSRLSLSSLYTRQQQQQQPGAPPSHHNKGRGASTNYSQLPSPLSAATVCSPSSSNHQQQQQHQLQEHANNNATVPLHYFENTLEEHHDTTNWLDAATDTTQSSTTSAEPSSSSFAQQRKHLLPTPQPSASPAFFSPALRASLASMTPRNMAAVAKPALCFARLSSPLPTPQEEKKAMMMAESRRSNNLEEYDEQQQDSRDASSLRHQQAKVPPCNHNNDNPLHASSGILQVPGLAETFSSLSCAEDDGFSIFGGMPQRLGPAFNKSKTFIAAWNTPAAGGHPQRSDHHDDIQHWINRASHTLEHHGVNHITTANAFLDLGQAYLRAQDYTSAQDVCKTAIRVYERTCRRSGFLSDECDDDDDDNHLRLAKALDVLGMAQSGGGGNGNNNYDKESAVTRTHGPTKTSLLLGIQSLRKSFRIRYDKLGPAHVDTVETLNKIANIYMALGMYSSACMDFREVMELRKAIMGEHHPSVAIAAQSVGNAHLKLKENSRAKAHYLQALNTFAVCGLADHKVAKKLRDDVRLLGFDFARVEI